MCESQQHGMSSTSKIAIYFGSFDPIHINHIGLCKDLIKRGFHKIYLVPNQNNTMKPYTVPRDHRYEMICLAIDECQLQDYLVAYKAETEHHTWEGRSQICDQIMKEHEGCRAYQIIGQDSYEKALERCQPGNGIYSLTGRLLMVYPRQGYYEGIKIPSTLKGSVEIVSDYKDALICSSTVIRETFTKGITTSELDQWICQSVHEYIFKYDLYKPLKNTKKIIALLGPPGSGKGTLSCFLMKQYPKYQHISTGDIYRADQLKKTPEYLKVAAEKEKGYVKYMEALNEYIIGKLKTIIDPKKYYIIDGLKPTDLFKFEQEVAPIDSIVILNCQYPVAEARLKKRQKEEHRPDDSDEQIKKRLNNYYHFIWMQKEIVKSYTGTGRTAINLNCQKPAHVLAKHLLWKDLLCF